MDAGRVRAAAGYDPAHVSRIESGKRPATEVFAKMCDQAFPHRAGWFAEFYEESRSWIATPPWFRNYVSHEQRAVTLRNWFPSLIDGLLQTEDYARTILARQPRRNRGRGERSARGAAEAPDDLDQRGPARSVVPRRRGRAAPPCRLARNHGCPDGAPGRGGAAADHHDPGGTRHTSTLVFSAGFSLTDRAAYVETAVAGQVFEDAEIIAALLIRFDTLRSEALRASESLAFIERMCEEWKATGARAATQVTTEEPA